MIPVLVPFNRPSDARLLLPAGATMERVQETQTSLPCVRKPGYNKVEFPGDFRSCLVFPIRLTTL